MYINNKIIASMRGIALDSINRSKGGHMGMAIGAAAITKTIILDNLNISKDEAKWINRDRFVLSAGHGSMSFYSIMHFLGLLSLEDMKNHKQLYSKTPSHPEVDRFAYVDASTGPLGQGVAMGVGMAISQYYLAQRFNRPGYNIFNHHIYVLAGDGCLQEGVALEAIQLAGTLKLNKFILVHDYNNAQIDSLAKEVNNTKLIDFFKANNFNVFEVYNDDANSLNKAILEAKKSNKPSYIKMHTTIAKATPVEGMPKGHNGTLSEEQTIEFKKNLGLENFIPFEYDNDVYEACNKIWEEKDKVYQRWNNNFKKYQEKYPEEYQEIKRLILQNTKFDFSDVKIEKSNLATRNYFAPIMQKIENEYFNVLGGSADLKAATKIGFSKDIIDGGQNIKYGIREFAMSAINNGINLHSGIKTLDATFLVFADYAKAALRLGSIMEIPAIHIYTHDSYQVGGDGPTHQPLDQLPMLRAMANFKVIRPADENEVIGAFNYAFNQRNHQIAIIGCRQNIRSFNVLSRGEFKPAYIIKDDNNFDLTLLASGSEVQLAMQTAEELKTKYRLNSRVISVPCLQNLLEDENLIKELKLSQKPMFAMEASTESMYYRLSKYNRIECLLASDYGFSADGQQVYELKGFSVNNAVNKILEFLNNN